MRRKTFLEKERQKNATRTSDVNAPRKPSVVQPPARKGGADGGNPETEKKRTPSTSETLVAMVPQDALFHDAKGTAYVTVGRMAMEVESASFKEHLSGTFYRTHGRTVGTDALDTATRTMVAEAKFGDRTREPGLRFAAVGNVRYVALCDKENRVVEIDSNGWRLCENPPVVFRKTSGALPLPEPVHGGSLDELWPLLNLPDEDTRVLVVGWMVGVVNHSGPEPLLILTGPQGSCKSTTARFLQRLTDPNAMELARCPGDTRDLAVAAEHSAVLSFDNVSKLNGELSDGFCRLATGGSLVTRKLYSDGGASILTARRPCILNGITDFATKADLLSRAIIIRHECLPEGGRLTESELESRFYNAHGRILGAIFDRVSAGLKAMSDTPKPAGVRMIDFAQFGWACERGMREPERFVDAYRANQDDGQSSAIDGDPVAESVLRLMESQEFIRGTAGDLFSMLHPNTDRKSQSWPLTPKGLASALSQLAEPLRTIHGIYVTWDKKRTSKGRVVEITRYPSQGRNKQSQQSQQSLLPNGRTEKPGENRRNDCSDGSDGLFPKSVGALNRADMRDSMPPD